MNRTSRIISTYSADVFGVCSALFELGGMVIMHDASGGRFTFFDTPMIRDMGEYISRSYVKDGWVVNFADATAKLSFTPSLIYNYGKAVSSREMMDFAIYNLAQKSKGNFKTQRLNYFLNV